MLIRIIALLQLQFTHRGGDVRNIVTFSTRIEGLLEELDGAWRRVQVRKISGSDGVDKEGRRQGHRKAWVLGAERWSRSGQRKACVGFVAALPEL
jgi:hypothetical protein